MSVFSLFLAEMLCSWNSLWMPVMFLVHGLSGLVLLRLLLLTLVGSAGVLFLARVWFLGGRVLCFGLCGLVVTKGRKARGNASDVVDGAGVFLYRDSSIAPLLDMRRRFKAVMEASWSLSFSVG